jgi:glycosyltransferase involved in cell wall biosynthesis
MLSGDASVAQGQEGAFSFMLSHFARHWERIDILTPHAQGAQPRTLYGSVHVHPSPYHRALQPWYVVQQGRRLLAERPYGLVVSHDFATYYNGWGALWLMRGRPEALVSEVYHVEGFPITSPREALWNVMARLYLPLMGRRMDAMRVSGAPSVLAILKALGVPESKFLELPSVYLDLQTYRPLPEVPKAYDALFVGRLASNKGLPLLLEAWARLVRTHPQARLALRGDGPLEGWLSRFVAQHGLADNVLRLPRQPIAAMPALYNAARSLICASTVEGNPRVTLEAMACGVPTISTRVGIMPLVIEHGVNGWLIERDPDQLAGILRALLDDEALAARIGQAGQQAAQAYEAERTIARYAQAYQDLAQRVRGHG